MGDSLVIKEWPVSALFVHVFNEQYSFQIEVFSPLKRKKNTDFLLAGRQYFEITGQWRELLQERVMLLCSNLFRRVCMSARRRCKVRYVVIACIFIFLFFVSFSIESFRGDFKVKLRPNLGSKDQTLLLSEKVLVERSSGGKRSANIETGTWGNSPRQKFSEKHLKTEGRSSPENPSKSRASTAVCEKETYKTTEEVIKKRNSKPKGKKKYGQNCNKFNVDWPNWTIKFTQTNTTQKCSRKKFPKWIKRIILSNGTILSKGCTRNTKKCREHSYFNWKLNSRINSPPCCLQHVVDIFRDTAKLLDKYGGMYFLFAGGLIGWYRNRSIVPYDHDLDIIVDLDFWKSRNFKKLLQNLKKNKGYYVKKLSWNKIKIYFSIKNHNFIDLWPFSRHGNDQIKIKSSTMKIHKFENILPLRRSTFEGFKIWVPQNPEAALNLEYGKGWKTELTCKKIGKYGNCKT